MKKYRCLCQDTFHSGFDRRMLCSNTLVAFDTSIDDANNGSFSNN